MFLTFHILMWRFYKINVLLPRIVLAGLLLLKMPASRTKRDQVYFQRSEVREVVYVTFARHTTIYLFRKRQKILGRWIGGLCVIWNRGWSVIYITDVIQILNKAHGLLIDCTRITHPDDHIPWDIHKHLLVGSNKLHYHCLAYFYVASASLGEVLFYQTFILSGLFFKETPTDNFDES